MPRKKPQPLDNEKSSDPAKISEDLIPLARPVDQFAQLPGNPRRGDVAAVARSLASFGQRKPIVALRDGVVLAGNHTLQAGSWHVMLGDRVLVLTGTDVKVRELESSVVEYSKPSRSELHPTMKPVALVERQIMNSSRAGDVVLDLFGGSGSTLIAAHTTSREARLVELDPRFCDVICKRFQMATGIVPIAEATGREHDFCEDTDATQGHRSNRRKAPAA